MPSWLVLLVALGATARLSRLITVDYLTLPLRERVANRFGPEGMLAYLVSCPWCMSMWVAPFVMAPAFVWPDNRLVVGALAALTASHVAGLLIAELEV